MKKALNADFSGPFQVGAYENYLSKFIARFAQKKRITIKLYKQQQCHQKNEHYFRYKNTTQMKQN